MKHKTTNRKIGRPKDPNSLASIAERLTTELGRPVTIAMVRAWKSNGYPLDNPAALQNEIDGQTHQSAGACPEHIREAIQRERLRKLTVEADAKEFALAVERKEYVTLESQIRWGLEVGNWVKSLVLKIPAELPQMILGLDYADALAKCEDYAYQILNNLWEAGMARMEDELASDNKEKQ